MELISIEDFQDQAFQVIERATNDLQQFRITSPQGTVILLSEETYKNILVTLEVLSTPGLMDALKTNNLDS